MAASNGRVYDPTIARFLSPDPMLQSPNNALNYNRYTYCMNNPMLYTDPSGMSWFSDLWDGVTNANDWFWDTMDKSAQWLEETGISVDAGIGYNSAMGMYTEGGGYRQYTSAINSKVEENVTGAMNEGREVYFQDIKSNSSEKMSSNGFKYSLGDVTLDGLVVSGFQGNEPLSTLSYDFSNEIEGYSPAIGLNGGGLMKLTQLAYSFYASAVLTEKMTGEISRIKSKPPGRYGIVYQLMPIKTGSFLDRNTGKVVTLHPTDVYKYGQTINPNTRYSSEQWLKK